MPMEHFVGHGMVAFFAGIGPETTEIGTIIGYLGRTNKLKGLALEKVKQTP